MTAAEQSLARYGLVSARASITAMARKVTRNGVVQHASGLKVRRADLSQARRFRWAWNQRVLMGYINLQVGEEGIGKGNLAAYVAARITRGELDGDLKGTPRKVVFIGDEDSWPNIWVPRLYAAGANLDLVELIEAGAGGGVLDVSKDADALANYAKSEKPAWAYFDQLLDNLGKADNWKEKDIRDALAPLRKVVRDADLALTVSLHPNKRKGSFRDQVSGTPAFNALSRCSLLVAHHPNEPGRVVVVRAKGNYSVEPPAFEFRIEEREVLGAELITTSRITGVRETGLRADDVLDSAGSRQQENSNAGKARAMLSELLPNGTPRRAAEILEIMKAHGFTERQAQSSREDLGFKTWKEDRFQGTWTWGTKPLEVISVKSRKQLRSGGANPQKRENPTERD
jgi:hypothetical protein